LFDHRPFLDRQTKAILRALSKSYYRGYVVDKAIDDFISKWTGETWITENIVGKGGIFKDANDPPDPHFTALVSPPKLRGLRDAPRQVGERDRREAALYRDRRYRAGVAVRRIVPLQQESGQRRQQAETPDLLQARRRTRFGRARIGLQTV
jgi:hypothetical protein